MCNGAIRRKNGNAGKGMICCAKYRGGEIMPTPEHTKGLLRLRQILELIPISRSAWWAGCKSGRYPKPIKLGPRTAVWKAADIYALLDKLSSSQKEEE